MIEFLHTIWISGGDEAVIFSNWILVIVTSVDAKVGIRIYTRMTTLINVLTGVVSGKPEAPAQPDPKQEARAEKALNSAHCLYLHR